MADDLNVTILATEYALNALHEDARVADWWNWNVYVRRTRRDLDRWIVTDGHAYYGADGRSHLSVLDSGDLSRAEAITLAGRVARTMILMGETAEQASVRILAGGQS